MTFEKWMEIHKIRHSTGQDPDDEGLILADWKAERERLTGVLERARRALAGKTSDADTLGAIDAVLAEAKEKR